MPIATGLHRGSLTDWAAEISPSRESLSRSLAGQRPRRFPIQFFLVFRCFFSSSSTAPRLRSHSHSITIRRSSSRYVLAHATEVYKERSLRVPRCVLGSTKSSSSFSPGNAKCPPREPSPSSLKSLAAGVTTNCANDALAQRESISAVVKVE